MLQMEHCSRVLKPQKHMLIYVALATELLTSQDAETMLQPTGVVAANMNEDHLENMFREAGFQIDTKDVIATEWREYWEESNDRVTADEMLMLARLRRSKDEFVRDYGSEVYTITQSFLLWGTYQMIGKLQPTMYVLKNSK